MSELDTVQVTIVTSTREFTEAMFKANLAFVRSARAMRKWARAYRLAFPVKGIHANARRRPKRQRR